MRQQLCLFKVLMNALVMILTLVVCWMVLGTTPLCEYDCLRTVGPGNCKEVVTGAQQENPNCLGIYACHPAPGEQKDFRHVILDDGPCRTSTGKFHLQHITTIEWDTDKDGKRDTICNALHSCP